MSIYATLWRLKFPRHGDGHTGCGWLEVVAQGVPAHVGTPTPGLGYEAGDPYAAFLPPAVQVRAEDGDQTLRAVVIVTAGTRKGTHRSSQEYTDPLLVLSGQEYSAISFGDLHARICNALRGDRPRCIAEFWANDRHGRLLFEDGSLEDI
jgi:hypothetical protein